MQHQSHTDQHLSFLLPGFTVTIATLLSVFPLHLPSLMHVMPLFNLMAIYYWAIYRSTLLPVSLLFILGLAQDAMYGLPIGVTAFTNVMLYGITTGQQRFFIKEHFIVVWLGFLCFSFIAGLIYWLLLSLYFQTLFPFRDVTVQWTLSVTFYACIHWILCKVFILLPDKLLPIHA